MHIPSLSLASKALIWSNQICDLAHSSPDQRNSPDINQGYNQLLTKTHSALSQLALLLSEFILIKITIIQGPSLCGSCQPISTKQEEAMDCFRGFSSIHLKSRRPERLAKYKDLALMPYCKQESCWDPI